MMLLGEPEEILETIQAIGGDKVYCNLGLEPDQDDLIKCLLAAR